MRGIIDYFGEESSVSFITHAGNGCILVAVAETSDEFVNDVMFAHNGLYGAWLAGRTVSGSTGRQTGDEVMMSTIASFITSSQ